jgi:hypothetical protein
MGLPVDELELKLKEIISDIDSYINFYEVEDITDSINSKCE